MPFVYGLVQVAYGAQSQYVLPAVVLLEYSEHLVLWRHLAQLVGILGGGKSQQQAVVVFL